jgi:hypothetical protein
VTIPTPSDPEPEEQLGPRYPTAPTSRTRYGQLRQGPDGTAELIVLDADGVTQKRMVPTPDGNGWMPAPTTP